MGWADLALVAAAALWPLVVLLIVAIVAINGRDPSQLWPDGTRTDSGDYDPQLALDFGPTMIEPRA